MTVFVRTHKTHTWFIECLPWHQHSYLHPRASLIFADWQSLRQLPKLLQSGSNKATNLYPKPVQLPQTLPWSYLLTTPYRIDPCTPLVCVLTRPNPFIHITFIHFGESSSIIWINFRNDCICVYRAVPVRPETKRHPQFRCDWVHQFGRDAPAATGCAYT